MSWVGVRIGALNLLAPVAEVAEVLHLPACTPVPLTLPWFRGLHNVRGTLYSVIDLPALFGFAPVALTPEARVLLLAPSRMRNTALLVNRLAGMHANANLVQTDRPAALTQPALGRSWLDGDQVPWHELDLAALVSLPEFLDVAAAPPLGAHP